MYCIDSNGRKLRYTQKQRKQQVISNEFKNSSFKYTIIWKLRKQVCKNIRNKQVLKHHKFQT